MNPTSDHVLFRIDQRRVQQPPIVFIEVITVYEHQFNLGSLGKIGRLLHPESSIVDPRFHDCSRYHGQREDGS